MFASLETKPTRAVGVRGGDSWLGSLLDSFLLHGMHRACKVTCPAAKDWSPLPG